MDEEMKRFLQEELKKEADQIMREVRLIRKWQI